MTPARTDETSAAIVALEAAEQAIRATRAILASQVHGTAPHTEWISAEQLAARGVFASKRAAHDAHRKGLIAGARSGRVLLFAAAEVERFLRERTRRPHTVAPATTNTDDAEILARSGLKLVRGAR